MSEYHNPVLLKESVDALAIKPDGVYVDVTFGGGGHSKEILNRLGDHGRLLSFDQDADAQANQIKDSRFTFVAANFRYIKRYLRFHNVDKVDGILADLGVSSHQFDEGARGFSTRFDGPLDMRMNVDGVLTAYDVVNAYEEKELADMFFLYGELRNAKKIARLIVEARVVNDIKTIFQLKEVLVGLVPKAKEHKVLAQIFQAIRIEVNEELEVLKEFLQQVPVLLKDDGRLSVISYHSLEDRLVKRYVKNGMFSGEPERDVFGRFSTPLKPFGKLIVPSGEEVKENNRARSAKLRIATKSI